MNYFRCGHACFVVQHVGNIAFRTAVWPTWTYEPWGGTYSHFEFVQAPACLPSPSTPGAAFRSNGLLADFHWFSAGVIALAESVTPYA